VSHRYRKLPASTRMYRHFAVVTLAATGMLALFAEGERAKAVTQQTEPPPVEEPAAPAREKTSQAAVQQPGGVWGEEAGALGQAIAGAGSSSAWWAEFATRGHSSDYLAQLSEEERRQLESAMAENAGGSLAANRGEIIRLEAASHLRSGSRPDPM
jgi:hypothetical protein